MTRTKLPKPYAVDVLKSVKYKIDVIEPAESVELDISKSISITERM